MLMSNLAALMPLGSVLPDGRFFEPTPAFLAACDAFRGLTVYDVGCGEGHVAEALRARGHRALGIDVAERPSQRGVLIANGATFAYEPGSVVLLCRPCHGVFVEGTIERAVARDVAHVVYVGLVKNRRADLGAFDRRFRLCLRGAGESGERMWIWSRR